jgi:hypothetical protein
MLKWWPNETDTTKLRASVHVTLDDGVSYAPMATVFAPGELLIRLGGIAWIPTVGAFTNTGIDGYWVYEGDVTEAAALEGNQAELLVNKSGFFGRTSIGIEDPDAIARAVWNVLVGVIGGTGTLAELILRPSGAVVADGSNTTLTFKTNLASTSNDAYKDQWCCFLDGALAGQVHKVTGYNGTTKFLTFTTPFTGVPAGAARFMLVNK